MAENSLKSTAVVKFDPFKLPDQFNKVAPQTDLHKIPEDWLLDEKDYSLDTLGSTSNPVIPRPTAAASQPLSLVSAPGGSFNMAYNNVDMVGDVDVIAHSDVVKKLIRLPFDKRQLSIVVHRIGKTLLLDEFDILALLIATQETEWQWIREFVQNHVLDDLKRKNLHIKRPYGRSTPAAMEHSMMSKFLHYSVPKMLGSQSSFSEETVIAPPSDNEILNLPEPNLKIAGLSEAEKIEDSSRTVLWEFENMQMLLGSNLPIFGGADHPVVSLRLHDDSKPINVLTGLDYWLDNLICNVPELAMCFHINGIVQKYEVYKTMDIPNLESSKFSPTAVRDIAQNILSFLNNNCTKEGHTYWLFKPHGDEIVKLYDLTSICETTANEQETLGSSQAMHNPFAIPVAFLLYRVAKNLVAKFSHDSERSSKVRDTVYSLLRNALKLIRDVRTQSETTSSAGSSFSADAQFKNLEGCIYFLLVQLYIPSGPWKDWASGSSEDTESVDDLGSECGDSLNTDLDDASTRTNSPDLGGSQKPGEGPNSSDGQESDVYKGVSIERKTLLNKSDRSLIKEHRKAHEYSHLDLTIEERCRSALEYTLKCFQFLDSYSFEHRSSDLPKSNADQSDETSLISVDATKTWKDSIRCSLQYKLAVILSTFGLQFFETGKYGRAFRYLKLALSSCCSIGVASELKCDETSGEKQDEKGTEDAKRGSLLLGKILQLMGDVFMFFASCTKSPEQAELHIEEATKGHTEIELQLSCYLTPDNNEIYAKMDQHSICGDYERCIDSAAGIYNICRDHMATTNYSSLAKNTRDEFSNVLEQKWSSTYKTQQQKNTLSKSDQSRSKKSRSKNSSEKLNKKPSSTNEVRIAKKSPAAIDVQEWAFKGEGYLLKRMGNVNNELGRMYENRLMASCSSVSETGEIPYEAEDLLKLSKSHFEKAHDYFAQIGDRANVGLVVGNTGRLCRIWAYLLNLQSTSEQKSPTGNTEHEDEVSDTNKAVEESGVPSVVKSYYYKAIDYYRQALVNLENTGDSNLVSGMTWDLCTTYFTLGRLVQDNASTQTPKERERSKQEVIDNLTKAMKYCIPPPNICEKKVSENDILLKERHLIRLGEIHQRLGSLYHHAYRFDENAEKSMHALAEFHYSKAADCFHVDQREQEESSGSAEIENARLDRDDLYARVQLERVALLEFQLNSATIPKLICKMLNTSVAILSEAFAALERLDFEKHSLSTVFIQQIRKVLLFSFKFYSSSAGPKKNSGIKNDVQSRDKLKALYARSLKADVTNCQDWLDILKQFRNLMITMSI